MYSRGLSSRDIADQIEEIYGTRLSATAISRVTDKILPVIESWQNRVLEQEAISAVYPQTSVQRCIVHQVRYSCRFAQHSGSRWRRMSLTDSDS